MRIDVHLHDEAGDERFQTRVLNLLEALTAQGKTIMGQLDDIKAVATELKKDNGRMISALADARQGLADANAKIDLLLKSTHLSDADQATVNDIQAILTSTDDDIEAAVPEVPAPTPEPAP